MRGGNRLHRVFRRIAGDYETANMPYRLGGRVLIPTLAIKLDFAALRDIGAPFFPSSPLRGLLQGPQT